MRHNTDWKDTIQSHRLQYDGSNFSDSSSTRANFSWVITAGVFIIQLTVPTVFSSYGVFLLRLLENNYLLIWHGLLPPMTYIITRSFVDPICRNILSGQSINCKMRAACAVIVIAGSIAVNLFMQSIILQVLTFGVIGGIATSVVITQAEAVLSCHFPSQRGLTQVLCTLGVALGYFGMPLLINGLINQYGIPGGFLLHSGIILQALIGSVLLSPPQDHHFHTAFMNRPRAYTVVDDVEMIDFSSQNSGHTGHSPLLSGGRSWRNPGTDTAPRYDVAQTSSPIIIPRQKNINGVDILPEIPEESEENSSDSDNDISSMRQQMKSISRCDRSHSSKRQERPVQTFIKMHKESKHFINNRPLHKWKNINLHSESDNNMNKTNGEVSNQDLNQINNLEEQRDLSSFAVHGDNMRFQRLESISDQFGRPSVFQKIKYVLLCGCCNTASLYDCYITILNVPNDIHFHCFVPLLNAVKVPDFFPAVYLYTVLRLCLMVFTTFIPLFTRKRIVTSSPQEGAFTISVAAFSWLCFLLFSPCFLQAKVNTKKFIYFIGSMFISAGLYIVSTTRSHGFIVLGCAFFGLGYGATSGTMASILEGDMGSRNFVKIQGPLDVISGCIILLLSILLGVLLRNENGPVNCFFTLSVLQMATSIIWIISLIKSILIHLRSIYNSDWHPGGDFLTPG